MLKTIAVTAVLVIAASPALADWQYTHWGESLDDLLSQHAGAQETTPKETKDYSLLHDRGMALARADYAPSGLKSAAYFEFDGSGRLVGVLLDFPVPDDRFRVLHILQGQYGAADIKNDDRSGCDITNRTWRDEKAGNLVAYSATVCANVGTFTSVTYTPLKSSAETGL